jgi:hypothetical protein
MASQLLNARERLARCGNRNSEENREVEQAAFDIIFSIFKAFLPDRLANGTIQLPGACRIIFQEVENGRMLSVHAEVNELIRDDHSQMLSSWWVNSVGEVSFFSEHRAVLSGARILAEHIADGWLSEVLTQLEKEHGREAAAALADEFAILLEVPES